MYIWTLIYRLEQLEQFRELLIRFYNGARPTRFSHALEFTEDAAQARFLIDRNINEAARFIREVGVSDVAVYTPPPMIGGYITQIHLIANYHRIYQWDCPPSDVIAIVDRAIGSLSKKKLSSLLHTLNPINWLLSLISALVSIPFRLFSIIGLDGDSIEKSGLGKAIKAISMLAGLAVSIGAALEKFGLLNFVKNLFLS